MWTLRKFILLIIIGAILVGSSIYVAVAMTSSSPAPKITMCCEISAPVVPLGYTAYQITNATGEIDLFYNFPSTNGSGIINMTTIDYGPIIFNNNNSGTTYSECTNQCNGITITSSQPELYYDPSSNASVLLRIDISNFSQANGDYLLFPPDGQCGYYIFIIVGNQVPSRLPSLVFNCPAELPSRPSPTITVVGIENMTGLNIPISGF